MLLGVGSLKPPQWLTATEPQLAHSSPEAKSEIPLTGVSSSPSRT